ncbi:non-specific serine/threonine protein kinase [Malassezia brasiliensis]|uniref:non-specific serine/threonine protein kinase n=1 Tax=Malassezia brasiliensis TaxID=1821822 RepID=A0AAF0DYM7_9BASI|nr:non-specific serine/threonine protein kinase [Malassezia brasiliensis]
MRAGAEGPKRPHDTDAGHVRSDEVDLETMQEPDYDRLIEERRKRRRAILEKHAADAPGTDASKTVSPAPQTDSVPTKADGAERKPDSTSQETAVEAQPASPAPFMLNKDAQDSAVLAQRPSAHDAAAVAPEDASGIAPPRPHGIMADDDEYVEIEVEDDESVDDMFNLDDTPRPKKTIRMRKDAAPLESRKLNPVAAAQATGAGLQDNWDDPDGYYRVILGEKLDGGRYQVFAILGRGMFSGVVRARDLHDNGREVAIKIARSQETMFKAGMKEIGYLEQLAAKDPEDKKHVVRLYRHFLHRGHLCMVFESLSLNLREIVKRFGKDVGLNLQAVRAYMQQALLALALLRQENLIHADIKPDNIMVNDAKTLLKLCDLGSASSTNEMEITPYLVSRFYRAPEIILGQPYGCEIDMWSMGCTLYELATGKILFPGKTNNHMLLLMQQLKGRPTAKQLKKSQFAAQHFEDNHTFLSIETDKSTGQEIVRRVNTSQPVDTMRARLLPGDTSKQLSADELRRTQHLIDLLNRMLELDPAKRITPLEALAHPFVR